MKPAKTSRKKTRQPKSSVNSALAKRRKTATWIPSSSGDDQLRGSATASASAAVAAATVIEERWDWESILVRNGDAHRVEELREMLEKVKKKEWDLEDDPLLQFDWRDTGALLASMQANAAAVPPVPLPPYLQAHLPVPVLNASSRQVHRAILDYLRAVPGALTRRFSTVTISCTNGQEGLIIANAMGFCFDPYITALLASANPPVLPFAKILQPTPKLVTATNVSPHPLVAGVGVHLWG